MPPSLPFQTDGLRLHGLFILDPYTAGEESLAVAMAAGTFTGCIKTEDVDPIGGATEFKYYCPNVGLVMEESEDGETLIELFSF